MADNQIKKAVDNAITKIAVAQQNIAAFRIIIQRQYLDTPYMEAFDKDAVNSISATLHAKLNDAWNNLSWFAPISKEALDMLAERTRTWFTEKDTEIMSFLGEYGSYYTAEEKAFRREVMAKFQGRR